jgi:hypothetical protein
VANPARIQLARLAVEDAGMGMVENTEIRMRHKQRRFITPGEPIFLCQFVLCGEPQYLEKSTFVA